MSSFLDLLTAFAFTVACSGFASIMFGGKLPKWWFWIVAVPLFSWGLALAVALFPRPFSPDFNTGRADFIALVFFGVVLPTAYLAVALSIALVRWSLKSRAAKK